MEISYKFLSEISLDVSLDVSLDASSRGRQVKSQAEEAAKLAADSSKMIVETESFSARLTKPRTAWLRT